MDDEKKGLFSHMKSKAHIIEINKSQTKSAKFLEWGLFSLRVALKISRFNQIELQEQHLIQILILIIETLYTNIDSFLRKKT